MREKIVLIGGGGHCKACIDVIEKENRFDIAGIVDEKGKVGSRVSGYKVFANDRDLPGLAKRYNNFLITIGQIKEPERRIGIFKTLKRLKMKLPVVISPFSYVSNRNRIDEGTIIMHGVHINRDVSIGKNCIINTSSVIEHDSIVENHCHISTRAVINGGCSIEKGVFIGSGSIVKDNLKIARFAVLGAGSVVVKSIEKKGIYAGNPARKIK